MDRQCQVCGTRLTDAAGACPVCTASAEARPAAVGQPRPRVNRLVVFLISLSFVFFAGLIYYGCCALLETARQQAQQVQQAQD